MPSVTVISRVIGSGSSLKLAGAAKTWRRHKALHRAFLGLRILLAATAAATSAVRAAGAEPRPVGGAPPGPPGRGATKAAGTRRAKAGTCAKAGTSAGSPPGAAGTCQARCAWDAWDADRRGTGPGRGRCAGAANCRGRRERRRAGDRRLACRAECLPPGQRRGGAALAATMGAL